MEIPHREDKRVHHCRSTEDKEWIRDNAIETAGSLDTALIAKALDGMDMLTFYGHLKFDTSAAKHGLQIGHEMVYVQWQKSAGSAALAKQIVWPAEGATAPALYPLP